MANFPNWLNQEVIIGHTAETKMTVSFGCFLLAPSIAYVLNVIVDLQIIPEVTTARAAIDSSSHDDKINDIDRLLHLKLATIIPLLPNGAKKDAVSELDRALHLKCKSRRESRAKSILEDLENTAKHLVPGEFADLTELIQEIENHQELTSEVLAKHLLVVQSTQARNFYGHYKYLEGACDLVKGLLEQI